MKAENRICQKCKAQFVIETEDFVYYSQIDVPEPTFCVECRMIRRCTWRPSWSLFKRKCDAPGHSEDIISVHPAEVPMPVYDHEYWKSDAWDPRDYGKDYDFNQPFFQQFKELLHQVPTRNLEIINSVNCDYCISATESKNCYMCIGTTLAEDCMYSYVPAFSRSCVDVWGSLMDERAYECFSVDKSFDVTFSTYSVELINCDFMYDCRSCSDCLGCVGLRNKKYHIFNKPYTKKEYKKERAKYDLGSYKVRQKILEKHMKMILEFPKKYANLINAPDCTGDNVENAKNCRFSFQIVDGAENSKFVLVSGKGIKDSYDVFGSGLKCNLLYDVSAIAWGQNIRFSDRVHNSINIQYSVNCFSSSNLFGCVGLRDKKYCILNKQYSKEEYEELVPKIVQQMKDMPYKDSSGIVYKYGEFLPSEISPISYNRSMAHDYFNMDKKKVLKRGYSWYTRPETKHTATLGWEEFPDHIKDVEDKISEEVVSCEHEGKCQHECITVYRITLRELKWYRHMNIPVPRQCPNCRHYRRTAFRTPYKLWQRQCMCQSKEAKDKGRAYINTRDHFHGDESCPNTFKTAWALEKGELIYCEECYHKEVL